MKKTMNDAELLLGKIKLLDDQYKFRQNIGGSSGSLFLQDVRHEPIGSIHARVERNDGEKYYRVTDFSARKGYGKFIFYEFLTRIYPMKARLYDNQMSSQAHAFKRAIIEHGLCNQINIETDRMDDILFSYSFDEKIKECIK